MQFKFWGVRGSIAVPGSDTLGYGGNTTCIEVRGDNGEIVVLDAGTGIFQLGRQLLQESANQIHLFISHTHWDHIQGLPMFKPIFVPGNQIQIYGPVDPLSQLGIQERLAMQMDRHFFPVQQSDLQSQITFNDLVEGQRVKVGSLTISSFLFNHPIINFGYKIDDGSKSLVFTGDHEWPINPHAPSDSGFAAEQQIIDKRRRETLEFIANSDVLVIDTAYTEEEYTTRHGWGHGTFDSSILAAREAKVKKLFLTHHEPTRNDSQLEGVFQAAIERNRVTTNDPTILLAKEGLEVSL